MVSFIIFTSSGEAGGFTFLCTFEDEAGDGPKPDVLSGECFGVDCGVVGGEKGGVLGPITGFLDFLSSLRSSL